MWPLTTASILDEQYVLACQLAESIPADNLSDDAIAARASVLSHRDRIFHNNMREHLRSA